MLRLWKLGPLGTVQASSRSPSTIAHGETGPPSDGTPIDLAGPVDPRYAEEGA